VLKLLVKWGRRHANFTSEIGTGGAPITSVLGMGANFTIEIWTGVPILLVFRDGC
jgi:hypothetical protein